MNQYLSDKLRNLSAVAILMVLYIHMFYTEGNSMPSLLAIERFIGSGICSVAVPLFYMISGFLFFLKVPAGLRSIGEKIRKRMRTLLVPYLLANILTFLFYVILNLIALKVTAIDRVVNFKVLDVVLNDGFWPTLELIFINPPIAFQLWFIRDLLVVIIFSPLLWFILKSISATEISRSIFILTLLSIFVLYGSNGYCAAFIWFSAGAFIALNSVSIGQKRIQTLTLIISIALYIGLSWIFSHSADIDYLCRYIPLIGIPALWYGYDRSSVLFQPKFLQEAVKYTFFVYLIHEPLLNIFKKLPLLFNRSEAMLIGCYILIPVIFYLCACILGGVIRKLSPKIYLIYTGGR